MQSVSLVFACLCLGVSMGQIHNTDGSTIAPPPIVDPFATSGAPDTPPPPSTAAAATDAMTSSGAPSSSAAPVDVTSGQPASPSTAAPASSSAAPASPTAAPVVSSSVAPVDSTSPSAPDSTQPPASSTVASTTVAPTKYPSIGEIVDIFNSIKNSPYFQRLDYDDQILVLELASGGEAGKITPILDGLGYERFLTFLYNIPLRYLDILMQFTLGSLQRERELAAQA